jgi:hypothetical protein
MNNKVNKNTITFDFGFVKFTFAKKKKNKNKNKNTKFSFNPIITHTQALRAREYADCEKWAKNKGITCTEKTIGGKTYIVKSVFVGDRDINSRILDLAERKTIKEMGLDTFTKIDGNSDK